MLLAFGGFIALIWRDWRLAALVGLGLVCQWLFYFNYHIWDIYVFYISGYLLLALLAGAGFGALGRLLARGRWPGLRFVRPLLLVVLAAAALQPVLAPNLPAVTTGEPPFLTAREYPANTGTRYLRAEVANTVKELEPDAIVFVDWNRLFPLYYAAQVEGNRRDLQFIEAKPRSESSDLADSVIEFVAARVDGQPIYSINRLNELERAGFTFQPISKGPLRLFKIQRK